MENERKRKWMRRAIIAGVLAVIAVFAAFKWEDCLRALIYHRAVRYDEPFGTAIGGADRIVVRADGFDCCGPVDETNILFVVTEPKQIADVANHIRFEPRTTTNSFMETCMCCGGPGIDWYRGKKRIVFTSMKHEHGIRWRGFSTMRILGFRVGYGDGPLTQVSRVAALCGSLAPVTFDVRQNNNVLQILSRNERFSPMKTSFTYWKESDGRYLGYLNDYPDHWTQGENLDDLKENLRDLLEIFGSEEIPGIRKMAELEYA